MVKMKQKLEVMLQARCLEASSYIQLTVSAFSFFFPQNKIKYFWLLWMDCLSTMPCMLLLSLVFIGIVLAHMERMIERPAEALKRFYHVIYIYIQTSSNVI